MKLENSIQCSRVQWAAAIAAYAAAAAKKSVRFSRYAVEEATYRAQRIANFNANQPHESKCPVCWKEWAPHGCFQKDKVICRRLPCGHCICRDCRRVLRSKGDYKCPLCRKEATNEEDIYTGVTEVTVDHEWELRYLETMSGTDSDEYESEASMS